MGRVITDEQWVVTTIYQEAANEPFDGKVAVAEVIRNRMRARYESDGTVAGTVLEAMAFSGWNSTEKNQSIERWRIRCAQIDWDSPAVKDCLKAWQAAQGGSDLAKGAVLYLNPKAVKPPLPAWADPIKKVAIVGAHHFFKP